jgi:hypothetical protein
VSITTLLPGVDQHGAGFRVRLRFPGLTRPHTETGFTTPDTANARVLELRALRDAGLTPASAPTELTLAQACDALLTRKRTAVSRRRRQRLRPRGLEHWERSLKCWRTGDYAALPLSHLRHDLIDDMLLKREAEAPTSARNELEGLKAVLRYALSRGARFDHTILAIDPILTEPREMRAITAAELELLAASARHYAQRLLLLKGTTGMRSGELFTLTDDRVDLAEATVFVPAHLCKEGRDKLIPLMAEEVSLLRRQLLERAPGTALVFPKAKGGQWTRSHFYKLVWSKARIRAEAAWRAERRIPDTMPTPYDGLVVRDLRATAATMMRDLGFSREATAARLGHGDDGELLDRLYDRGDRTRRVQAEIDRIAPQGLRAALAEPAPRRSITPAAVAVSASQEGT